MPSLLGRLKNKLPVPVIRTLFPARSPFLSLPWRPLDDAALAAWGRVVVVAPHQDDESLGCGGLIAKVRAASRRVGAVFVSDGSGSHRNSASYPPERLAALREEEAVAALRILGVDRSDVRFLRLRDRHVPFPGSPDFDEAVERFRANWWGLEADTVLLPWRYDPTADHRASWHVASAALPHVASCARVVEYPVWAWAMAPEGEVGGNTIVWRLDIRSQRRLKRRAIAAHRSQVSKLIRDDPTGFRLSRVMQANFDQDWELFFEVSAHTG